MDEARLLTLCLLNKLSSPHRVPCLQIFAAGSQICSTTGLAPHRCCSRRPWLTCGMTAQGLQWTILPGSARPSPQSWTCMRWSGAKTPVAVKQGGCNGIREKVACMSCSAGAESHMQGLCHGRQMSSSMVAVCSARTRLLHLTGTLRRLNGAASNTCPQKPKEWSQQLRTHLHGARRRVMGMPCSKALCVSVNTCLGFIVLSHTGLSLTGSSPAEPCTSHRQPCSTLQNVQYPQPTVLPLQRPVSGTIHLMDLTLELPQ